MGMLVSANDIADARDVLLGLLATVAYAYSPEQKFRLASGEVSSEYIDCKSALSLPAALSAASTLLLAKLRPEVEAVGGLTMGADPLAIGVSLASASSARPRRWFSVRKESKDHGRKRLIEGVPADSRLRIAVFDDVVTTGGSTLDAIAKCQDAGHTVVQVLAIVDRESGGLDAIRARVGASVPVEALVRLSEVHATAAAKRATTSRHAG
jgi:orotate phosphoribosyltransferase